MLRNYNIDTGLFEFDDYVEDDLSGFVSFKDKNIARAFRDLIIAINPDMNKNDFSVCYLSLELAYVW